MAEVQVKGNSLRRNFEVLTELHGPEIVERIVERLSPEFRSAWRSGTLLHGGWYPVSWVSEVLRALLLELPDVPDAIETMSRRGVEADMKGIYGFMARFVSPEFCIRQAPRVLGTYYKGAVIRSQIFALGHAELEFSECAGFGRLVWRDTVAAAQRILEEAGAQNVRLSFLGGGRDGDPSARIEVRWD